MSNPLTHALGIVQVSRDGDTQSELIEDLIIRIESLESRRFSVASETAAAIVGQGELATKNIPELRKIWLTDQAVANIQWQTGDDGLVRAEYVGFEIAIKPESNDRWSSRAVQKDSAFSVSYPSWRRTLEDAKTAIVRAIQDYLREIGKLAG